MQKVSKSKPNVTVFIPTGNRASSLKIVLDSLVSQKYKNFEIIIVDYKSKDNTFDLISKYQKKLDVKLIKQTKKGLAAAANLALSKSKGEIFIRTDDDVKMTPLWLEAIVKTFKDDNKIGGVTGPTVIPLSNLKNRDIFLPSNQKNQNIFWKIVSLIYNDYFLEGKPKMVSHWFDCGAFSVGSNFKSSLKEKLHEVDNLEACNFSAKSKILKSVGGFDTIYGGVGDYHEADAALKIKEQGYKLMFNPKAHLYHYPSQEGFFNDRPNSYIRMVNFIIFYLRHIKINSLKKLIKFPLYILFQDVYYVYQAIKSKQVNQLGALIGSISGFYEYLVIRKQK